MEKHIALLHRRAEEMIFEIADMFEKIQESINRGESDLQDARKLVIEVICSTFGLHAAVTQTILPRIKEALKMTPREFVTRLADVYANSLKDTLTALEGEEEENETH